MVHFLKLHLHNVAWSKDVVLFALLFLEYLKYLKLVIQGSHMVSGTQCPALSDQLMSWRRARQWPKRANVLLDRGVNFQTFREGKIEAFRAIFHVIQWECYIFLIFHKFSMLFNENFTFWAAAPKGAITYAFTQGKFLLLLSYVHLLLRLLRLTS